MTVSKSYSDPFSGFIASVRDEYSLLEPEDLKWIIAELNRVRRAADKLADEKKAELEEIRQHEAHIAQVTSMELPLDYNNAFSTDERAAGIIANSVDEGLILSLNTLGKVDIEFIAQICGTDCKTVIQSLRGAIYQNPDTWGECFYHGWETADEYLSGNLMRKYNTVKAVNADTLMKIAPSGGGGTSFHPIFQYVEEEMQDKLPVCIIILTDGCAPYPEEKAAIGIPVLWIINNEKMNPPWGKVIRLPSQE